MSSDLLQVREQHCLFLICALHCPYSLPLPDTSTLALPACSVRSELGMYYDPQRQLFGEAASGRWYSFDASTGQYTLAS